MYLYCTLSGELTWGNFTKVYTVEATVDGKSLAKASASKKKDAQTQVVLFSFSFSFCIFFFPSAKSAKAPCTFSLKSLQKGYTGTSFKCLYILMCLHRSFFVLAYMLTCVYEPINNDNDSGNNDNDSGSHECA